MREIEFRAWHDGNNTMVYFKNEVLVRDEFQMKHLAALFNGDFGDVLMQYTGLKDKTGKKIFEGDIVKDLGVNCVVKFINGAWVVELDGHGTFLFRHNHNYEVIGDIHNNPELFKYD